MAKSKHRKQQPPVSRSRPQAAAPAARQAAASATATARKTVLHVGCGLPGPNKLHQMFKDSGKWQEIRFDINPDVKPDIVGDIRHMDQVAESSMDAVWSSHNLEHLYAHQVPLALNEFFRVIRPGGFALIAMPDIERVAMGIINKGLEEELYTSPIGPICAIDILYGHRGHIEKGNEYMAHRTAFTARTLGHKLRAAGFVNIRVIRDGWNLWAQAFRLPESAPNRETFIRIVDKQSPTGLPDELTSEPQQWKPLNLGLKK